MHLRKNGANGCAWRLRYGDHLQIVHRIKIVLVQWDVLAVLVNPQELAFLVKFGQAKCVLFEELHGGAISVEFLHEGADISLNVLNSVDLLAGEEYLSLKHAAHAAQVFHVIDYLNEEGKSFECFLPDGKGYQRSQHGLHVLREARKAKS